MKTYCKQCKVLRYRGEYCQECGTKLVKNISCSCGEQLICYDKFCPKCGKKVEVNDEIN